MRFIIALVLPPLLFLTIGRIFAAIICAILQFSLFGWPVAAIWAVYALSQYNTDQKIAKATSGKTATPQSELEELKGALRFTIRRVKAFFGA